MLPASSEKPLLESRFKISDREGRNCNYDAYLDQRRLSLESADTMENHMATSPHGSIENPTQEDIDESTKNIILKLRSRENSLEPPAFKQSF